MSLVACTHCRLEFEQSVMIVEKDGNEKRYFCCKGCQGVFHLLQAEGLDRFYEYRGQTSLHRVSSFATLDDLERFDLEGFRQRYIREDENGFFTISLIIEGIHCSACIWLNEKVLHKKEGVIEASINYSTHKASVTFDPDVIALSEIIETIRSIGYNAFPYDPTLQEEQSVRTRRNYYTRILVAVFGAMNIMWLAVAHYAGYFSGIEQRFKDILNVAQFLLATPVLFYSGWVFFRGAYYAYKNRTVNMDTLVASGALSAYLYSIYAMVTHNGEVYFDSVVMIITFVLVGKYLEVLSKKQASDTLDGLMGALPTEVMRISSEGERELVAIEGIVKGDVIELRAGEKVVIDGELLHGEASFDESSLSGESAPVIKQCGDTILSGSVCLDATIRYRASKKANESLLHKIIILLEESVTKKPHIEQLANQISGYFSTVILAIALLTFAGWFVATKDFEQSLIVAISVIVIACPCALGLATPMATLVGISVGAKRGILFKEARHLETLAQCDVLALDKTGTLTQGKPKIIALYRYEGYNEALIRTLVSHSNHPISKAIFASLTSTDILPLHSVEVIQAKGIKGVLDDGRVILGGNETFLSEHGVEVPSFSSTSFYVALQGELIAAFELSDTLRKGVADTIDRLRHLGLRVVMLTGDKQEVAQKIAQQAGIDEVHASLLPDQKAQIITSFQEKGKRVVMVGDGINDAVALLRSDIAIAMGSGADVAISTSDVVLLDERFGALEEAIVIAKRSYRTIKENLGLSIVYNVFTIPIAMAGWVNPLIAALSMSLSSLIVVANSMRISQIKHRFPPKD